MNNHLNRVKDSEGRALNAQYHYSFPLLSRYFFYIHFKFQKTLITKTGVMLFLPLHICLLLVINSKVNGQYSSLLNRGSLPNPTNVASPVGRTPGKGCVSLNEAAGYLILIFCPKGTGGLVPHICYLL
jgi:hypothetical protein